jgi:hypothetical protein
MGQEDFENNAGSRAIQGLIADAQEDDNFYASMGRNDPPAGHEWDGKAPGQWQPNFEGLPPDCPVLPLGVDGDTYFFLDTLGQLREVSVNSMGQKYINSLFMARHLYLYWAYPRKNKDHNVVGFRAEKVVEDLMTACARKGPWNAIESTRGRGAWRDEDGTLILHCGNQLYSGKQRLNLGELGGNVYPTRPPLTRPWAQPIAKNEKGPGLALFNLFKGWNWRRPELDPILLIGWLGAAFLGGALDWRPSVFLVGDKATGKSTLQNILKYLLGSWLIQSADTTAAGIYQKLKFDCLPVAVDEFEGKEDNRRTKAIIELARLAASGALMFRGGEAHSGVQFHARSAFLFSAINTPPLDPQDLSRMAMLQLKRLKADGVAPKVDSRKFEQIGRQLMRKLVDNWGRFETTFNAYREALALGGHDGRGQDTFGTLLACADLIIDHDAPALGLPMGEYAESLDYWTEALKAINMAEFEDATENWRKCLNTILTTEVEAWRNESYITVGALLSDFYTMDYSDTDRPSEEKVRKLLNKAGLTLQKPKDRHSDYKLAVPNNHPQLGKLLRGSTWQGSTGVGVWSNALRQAPEDYFTSGSCRIDGIQSRATVFDIDKILPRSNTDQEVETAQVE